MITIDFQGPNFYFFNKPLSPGISPIIDQPSKVLKNQLRIGFFQRFERNFSSMLYHVVKMST